jgi:hypothetical protein
MGYRIYGKPAEHISRLIFFAETYQELPNDSYKYWDNMDADTQYVMDCAVKLLS